MTLHFTLLKAVIVQINVFTLQSLPRLENILITEVSFALGMHIAYLNLR